MKAPELTSTVAARAPAASIAAQTTPATQTPLVRTLEIIRPPR